MSDPKLTPIYRFLRPWWRLTRGMTLGVQGAVFRNDGAVLLIRHGYRPGWHFPGGGVEWRETLEAALAREVLEETGVIVEGRPVLFGLFGHFATLPSDHVALFRVTAWNQPHIPRATAEIVEQRFFAMHALPADLNAGTRRRLDEMTAGAPPAPLW